MSITTFFHDDGDEIDIRRAFEFDSLQAIMPYCPIHFSHRRTLSSASTYTHASTTFLKWQKCSIWALRVIELI